MAELISRNAVITTIKNYGKGAIADGMKALDPVDDIIALVNAIKWLQVADVAPVVHGEWIPISDGDMAECSECGENYDVGDGFGMAAFELFRKYYRYCPNCGAKMDEVSE